MILTTSDPVCIARDPASLEPEWSELARRRAYPTVFLTPDWIRLARRHDRRQQITLGIADRGIAALALDADGTISFAGGEFTDYQDIVAGPQDESTVAGERAAVTDRFVALQRRSRGEKAEFMTPDTELFFRDVADTLAARGWLRLGVLSVDGEDAAVLFGFAYEGTLALYNAAYDPNLAPL